MTDDDPRVLPTPYPGWTVSRQAFDQSRDPELFREDDLDLGSTAHSHRGLVLVTLDAVVDADGRVGGLVQWVHKRFATEIGDPELENLIVQVTEAVRERHDEPVYLEVELYEDDSMVFWLLFDAEGLAELKRRTAAPRSVSRALDDDVAFLERYLIHSPGVTGPS